MKRLILVGTLAVGVCLAGLCLGQETTGSANALPANQKKLESLAYFLGSWELTGEINMAGQPTMKFAYERQFKWDLGNNFIHSTTTETKDGKTELRHRSMFGWEPKKQRIIEWGFWNLNLPDKTPTLAETVTLVQDGEKERIVREGYGLFTIIDPNTHKYECMFKGDDGSENSWHYTATRKTAAPAVQGMQTALPDNIVNELEFLVGGWTVEGEVHGKALEGGWVAKWSMAKHCLLITHLLTLNGEKVWGEGVMGWDTAKKELVIQMFYENGVMENVRFTVESPGVLKGVLAGSAGGVASTATCEMRTKRPNEWTFQTTGFTVDDKQEGELSIRFVRTEPKPTEKIIK